jgi:hypothetical protein
VGGVVLRPVPVAPDLAALRDLVLAYREEFVGEDEVLVNDHGCLICRDTR